jgi:DNA-binding SARP family transcriptional activator/predicted ATPase
MGPMEAFDGGQSIQLPNGRQYLVLAALLLDANRVVSTEHLIDILWPENPPSTARAQVHICVSALRRLFADHGYPDMISTQFPGYVIKVETDSLDYLMFDGQIRNANAAVHRGDIAEAVDIYRSALQLWRGPPLAGVFVLALQARAAGMEERRLRVLGECIELELGLGRHRGLVSELRSLHLELPLQESLCGQLMLALYRSGRKAEALAIYQTIRGRLADELGLDPDLALRQLQEAILSDDVPPLISITERRSHTVPVAPSHLWTPRQLPADIADFTGRLPMLGDLDLQLGGVLGRSPMAITTITGRGGVGKTALAVHFAHGTGSALYPDGQLFADLGGTGARPAHPSDLLARFLRALGVPDSAIPTGLAEQAETYRSLLANQKMLVVLDDALDEWQVIPLLPGSASCAVVVTSRSRMTGLAGAQPFEVGVMDNPQSIDLLGRIVGHKRISAEARSALVLVKSVGGLPLALRVIGSRLASRPRWTLASLVGRLSDEQTRLSELVYGELAVRDSLSWSYRTLGAPARRLFHLLAALDNPTYTGWVAAPLLQLGNTDAMEILDQLIDVHLLDVVGIDLAGQPLYRFHELTRLYAQEQLANQETDELRSAAMRRVVGHWTAMDKPRGKDAIDDSLA